MKITLCVEVKNRGKTFFCISKNFLLERDKLKNYKEGNGLFSVMIYGSKFTLRLIKIISRREGRRFSLPIFILSLNLKKDTPQFSRILIIKDFLNKCEKDTLWFVWEVSEKPDFAKNFGCKKQATH